MTYGFLSAMAGNEPGFEVSHPSLIRRQTGALFSSDSGVAYRSSLGRQEIGGGGI